MLINEDSFRSFFELSLDLFIIVDFDGNVLEANNVWEEALGYQRSDLLNHSLFEFVNADDQTATSGRMTESAQGQDIRNFENRWNAKDGSVRTLRWRSRVDHNRKLVFGVAVDVTAERIAFELLEHAKNDATESLRQETLAKREENLLRQRLLKLFMQVPALAAVLKGPGHVFELANENFQKLLGERDVVGLSAVVAIPGLDCTRVQILDNVYRTGRGYRATAEAVTADWRADGQMSERIFDFIYEPILASSGAVEGIWVLAVDVTDKLEMMRQLRISDRLSGIGKLAAGIAHEINNPLAYSVINLELALLSPVIDEQTRKLIDRCLDGLNRAAGIVAGLRLFSKIEDIPLTSIDVQTEIEAAVSIANHEIKKSGAQLSLQVVAGLQAKVQRGSLCQILTNLLVNSAHAIENSEEKQINLSTIVDEINRVLVLRIEDTGCGIEQSRLQKIFQPFETSKTSDKGSGLGLSIVHGLVSAFGGRLSVESSIGVGTAFEITIPLSEVHSKNSSLSGSAEVAPQASSLKKRILIVDDEEQIRLALKVSLQSHDVTCVASISEALAFLGVNGNAVDLILCDLTLGSESGRQFSERLRDVSEDAATKIVFMTGGVTDEETSKWLERISNRVLKKPFTLGELNGLVDNFGNATEGVNYKVKES